MANYATLKAAIQEVIKTNGNKEITGQLLQNSLIAMVNSLGANYQFAGVAVTNTNPGTPDQNVFYLAFDAGTYSNFGSTVLAVGQIGIFTYNGTWTYTVKSVVELVNDVTTGGANKALAAQQGVVLAGQISQLGQETKIKTERIPLNSERVVLITSGGNQNVFSGYVSYLGAIGGTGSIDYSHLKVNVQGKSFVNFLGGVMQSGASSSPRGYAFYDINDNVISGQAFPFEIGTESIKTTKTYMIPVPENAVYFRTCIKDNAINFGITVNNFFCYLCTGKDVKQYVDESIENAPYIKTANIIDNLESEDATKVLSAKQGKILDGKILLDNYKLIFVPTAGNQRITALDNLPAGTKIYRCYEDVSNEDVFNNLRYNYTLNGASANKFIYPSQTIVIGEMGETGGYFTAVNGPATGNVSVIINPRTDNKENALKYGTIGLNNLVGENVIFDVKNRTVSTTSGTDIWGSSGFAIPKIPKGAIVHIDFSNSFSSWLNRYRLYLNGASAYTNISAQKYTFVATDDITAIRVRIANADIVSGQTPPLINVKMWWEDIGLQFSEIKEKTTPLLSLSKKSFIDANPSGYDSINDKFTEGEYIVGLAPASNTVALMDIIANYVAKYTTTGNSYPYLQMRYNYGGIWSLWWKYPIGGNGYYKANQCKLVCPGTDKFASPWTANIQIRIVVPAGCELYINNINAEYSNSLINKDAFKVFQHGTERGITGADNKTNWDLWTHIGNYGAIVIPKRTTDGKWVCYHDDSFGDDPNVQVIGNPSAPLPAASMQACTFAETQTLEYKAANFYGDHDTIPLLSEFFAKCAQMGVHPALSCHPIHISEAAGSTWKYADWAEVKAMAKKYRVLDKLTIKCAFNVDNLEPIQNFFAIFGNDIESYIGDVSSEPTQSAIEALAGIGWDLNKVKVGFELVAVNSYFGDATIAAIEAANLIHGIAPGANSAAFYKDAKNLKDIIDKGCYEITADQFYSNGLNWA